MFGSLTVLARVTTLLRHRNNTVSENNKRKFGGLKAEDVMNDETHQGGVTRLT